MGTLSSLKEGPNPGQVMSLKITNQASKDKTPCDFVFMDSEGQFGILSIYHNNDKIYEEVQNLVQIFVKNPVLKNTKLKVDNYDI